MTGQKTQFNPHIYSIEEIPQFNIDYKGLIEYAHSMGKPVIDLSDKEKELFISNNTMEDVRKNGLKI